MRIDGDDLGENVWLGVQLAAGKKENQRGGGAWPCVSGSQAGATEALGVRTRCGCRWKGSRGLWVRMPQVEGKVRLFSCPWDIELSLQDSQRGKVKTG